MDFEALLDLLLFVVACCTAAVPGILFPPGGWYARLDKPRWRPPDRVFAPVWSVLYLMIAVAGWLAWRGADGAAWPALAAYVVQLALNASWTPLFFGLRRPDLALVDIVALWFAIVATIVLFAPLSATAAWLLVPYLAWVSFAVALNASIWWRNRPARRGEGSALRRP